MLLTLFSHKTAAGCSLRLQAGKSSSLYTGGVKECGQKETTATLLFLEEDAAGNV